MLDSGTERGRIEHLAAGVLDGTANPDGRGMLVRGLEYQPLCREDLDEHLIGPLTRLARLAATVADALRDCPDISVRRSAAVLGARAHPVLAAFDG